MAKKTSNPPTEEPAKDRFAQIPRILTPTRRVGLDYAATLLGARTQAMQRDLIRRNARFGTDSDGARDGRLQVAQSRAFAALIHAEQQIAGIEPPAPGDHRAILHGQVTNRSQLDISGLRVAAVDNHNNRLAEARTDDHGYYRLDLDVGETSGKESVSKASKREEKTSFHLQVHSPDGGMLFRQKKSMVIRAGRVAFRKIVLDGDPERDRFEPRNSPGKRSERR